jgi:hypothetical protein
MSSQYRCAVKNFVNPYPNELIHSKFIRTQSSTTTAATEEAHAVVLTIAQGYLIPERSRSSRLQTRQDNTTLSSNLTMNFSLVKTMFWGATALVFLTSTGSNNPCVVHAALPRRQNFHMAQKNLFPATKRYTTISRGGGGEHPLEAPPPVTTPRRLSHISSSAQNLARNCESIVKFVQELFQKFEVAVCRKIPQQLCAWGSENPTMAYCTGASAACVAMLSAVHLFFIHRAQKKAEYLMWDAKELLPEVWDQVEHDLNLQIMDDVTEAAMFSAMAKALWRQKGLRENLRDKVTKAKATQVTKIYQKHFPKDWEQIIAKQPYNDVTDASTFLAARPKLLVKLTRDICKAKFVALLRPDYDFGVGRKRVDLTEMAVSTMIDKGKNVPETPPSPLLDPQLLEQVADDLVMTCPMEHPQLWENVNAKLRPGQTLWDRHDLVLKLVKAIQQRKVGNDAAVDVGAHGKSNATQASDNGIASRREKHASS